MNITKDLPEDTVGGAAHMIDDCIPVDGISITNNVRDITGVVQGESDAVMCAEIDATPKYLIRSADDVENLKTFLARPNPVFTGTLAAGVGNTYTNTLDSRAQWIAQVGQQAFDRMVGAIGFRATLVYRLVVTATPFHQGVVALGFQYGIGTSTGINPRRGIFYYKIDQLPHVKLDVAEATEVILRVPYVSHYEYVPIDANVWGLSANDFSYGSVYVTRLTDFRLGGTQTAPRFNLYCSLEDVELIGAMPFETTSVTLQAGVAVQDKEAKAGGILSGTLNALSGVATQIGRIPSMSVLGANTAWFLRCAAKAASAFGFSRPMDTRAPKKHYIPGYRFEEHVDVPHTGYTLAPFQENKILTNGAVGLVDEDQMSFDSILTRPAMIYRGTLTSSAAAGDLIYGCVVSPSAFWFRSGGAANGNIPMPGVATATTSAFAPIHLCYIGSSFRYWRGSFKFSIKFSKTKMHGGRILLSYVPDPELIGGSAPQTSSILIPTVTGGLVTMEGYNKMFDLRDSSEVQFEVPYSSNEPYTAFLSRIGGFTMQLMQPLNSPTAAADSIDFYVSVEALPGFEFAGYTSSNLDAVNYAGNNSAAGVVLQAGGVAHKDDASQYIIGEKFNSIKQLLMIPEYFSGFLASNNVLVASLQPLFKRNYLPPVSGAVPLPTTSRAVYYAGNSKFLEMFAFVNGSTDYIIRRDSGTISIGLYANGQDGNLAWAGAGLLVNLYNRASSLMNTLFFVDNSNTMRVRIPAFSKFARIPFYPYQARSGVSSTTALVDTLYDPQYTPHTYSVRFSNTVLGAVEGKYTVGRSAGDDLYCSQYIGPPLCALLQAAQAVNPNGSETTNPATLNTS